MLRAWDDLVAAGYLRNATCEEGPRVGQFNKAWCWAEVANRFGKLDNERVLPDWVPAAAAAAARAATGSRRFVEALQRVGGGALVVLPALPLPSASWLPQKLMRPWRSR